MQLSQFKNSLIIISSRLMIGFLSQKGWLLQQEVNPFPKYEDQILFPFSEKSKISLFIRQLQLFADSRPKKTFPLSHEVQSPQRLSLLWEIRLFIKKNIRFFLHTGGVSGPGIFNASLWLGYLDPELKKKAKIRLLITKDQITKRLLAYLRAPKGLRNYTMTLTPIALRSWDEAKVMSWGLLMDEVNENFELKKLPWVYLLWEALNITGKTGWYNLQWCWTSAFCCAKAMRK